MTSTRLHRRHFLRSALAGGAVTLGLPLLECMLNSNGTALAQGGPLPRRVGVWFWGNGVRPEHWFPDAGASPAWDPSLKQHTKPLSDAGLAKYVSLVSGTSDHATREQAHHNGKNIVLTGTWDWLQGRADLGYGRSLGPSIDRIAAAKWKGLTKFDSLEFGVQEGFANNEPGNAGHFTSTNGPDSYNRPETSPLAMFNRLFGGGSVASSALVQQAAARRSVLDAVLGDAKRLSQKLGSADKARVQLHMDTIRSLERRLTTGGTTEACLVPVMSPADYPTDVGRQLLRGRNQSMSELLALALACDLVRSFTYQFTVFQTANVFVELDVAQEEFHEYAHHPDAQDDVRKVTNYTMENLAATLSVLKNTPEGAGNLLDNCAIMCTTEHTDPMSHSTSNIPMIIAGKSGGKLKGGVYYVGNNEKISKAGLTVMRAAGLNIPTFGQASQYGEPQTSDTFTALEG